MRSRWLPLSASDNSANSLKRLQNLEIISKQRSIKKWYGEFYEKAPWQQLYIRRYLLSEFGKRFPIKESEQRRAQCRTDVTFVWNLCPPKSYAQTVLRTTPTKADRAKARYEKTTTLINENFDRNQCSIFVQLIIEYWKYSFFRQFHEKQLSDQYMMQYRY